MAKNNCFELSMFDMAIAINQEKVNVAPPINPVYVQIVKAAIVAAAPLADMQQILAAIQHVKKLKVPPKPKCNRF